MTTARDTRHPAQPERPPSGSAPAAVEHAARLPRGGEGGRSECHAGPGLWLAIQSQGGCLVYDKPPVFVRSVGEARRTLLRIACEVLEEQKPARPDPEFFRFPPGSDIGWEELVRCESYRCYDPSVPGKGMEVSYALYEQGGLSGVGGMMWTYGVYLTVTGSPEVWGHPADVPCSLDLYDD